MKRHHLSGVLLVTLVACGGSNVTQREEASSRELFEVDLKTWEESAPQSTSESLDPVERHRTGEIKRRQLDRVLANGPGYFLRQLEVEPVHTQGDFAGHRILRVAQGPLRSVDAVPGDIILSVNDLPIGTPSDMQRLWENLRTAVVVRAWIQRGGQRHELVFNVVE